MPDNVLYYGDNLDVLRRHMKPEPSKALTSTTDRSIGIDITNLAITLIKVRLRDAFGDAVQYAVVGEPVSVPDAEALAEQDPYQFQWWALGLVGARPVEQKKEHPRRGIDGHIYFHEEHDASLGVQNMAPKNFIARFQASQSLIIWASVAAIFATVLGTFCWIVEDIATPAAVTVVEIISAIISVASLVVICWAMFLRALRR